ncbi:MAG: hypothetical protein Fur0019_17720 [Tibeticola sp.]
MPTLPVKYYTSGMPGAPVLSNNWGDLVGLLDACLVNGFGLNTIDSLTSSGGVATATVSTGHGFGVGQVVAISGATQPQYNGEFVVTAATANTFTYAVPGTPASPATTSSSLSAKVAPLGWEKAFSGANKAAYRSLNPQSPKNLLRVDDSLKTPGYNTSWAKWANVGIVEDLSDIDTIVGAQAPYDPNNPNQNWAQRTSGQWGWYKWYHARQSGYESNGDGGAGARNWVLVGDDRLFYLLTSVAPGYGFGGRVFYGFGDIESFKPGDQFGAVLFAHDNFSGNSTSIAESSQGGGIGPALHLDYVGNVALRSHTQLGNPVRVGAAAMTMTNAARASGTGPVPFPNGPDYSLWMLPTYCVQEDGHVRGTLPGLFWIPHNRPYSDLTVVDNVVGQAGKRFLLPRLHFANDTEGAQVAFDITGPWR